MKRNRKIALSAVAVVLLLVATFWFGGNAPGLQGFSDEASTVEDVQSADIAQEANLLVFEEQGEALNQEEQTDGADEGQTEKPEETAKPSSSGIGSSSADYSAPISESSPELPPALQLPAPAPAGQTGKEEGRTCTIAIRCDTILANLSWLDEAKHSLVPENGVILSAVTVSYQEGDSAFAVLRRETKRRNIHFEYTTTALYGTSYIEGIANLYELDCGERSGWMYRVNGIYPTYGASQYAVQPGDVIEWVYTCDWGNDIGGGSAGGRQ